ncbi:MAG: hypothetical protein QOH63_1092 [Acidobacteriota bacterium]|jgi:hypothetical protein|nr:hypothetical protein [Acidobacteriota bacterium]
MIQSLQSSVFLCVLCGKQFPIQLRPDRIANLINPRRRAFEDKPDESSSSLLALNSLYRSRS